MKLKSISDVVAYQQCCGCGACAWARPDTYEMRDVVEWGSRPVVKEEARETPVDAEVLTICPGIGLTHTPSAKDSEELKSLRPGWGPILGIWEGYATDEHVRFASSSGGIATALALHGLEKGGAHGVLHVKAREDAPYLNEAVLSKTRKDVLKAMGSRYAPASPCAKLGYIEAAPGPCVFIGKPCDVAATRMAAGASSRLAEKLQLTVAIFCAGTPSTRGTLKMIQRMGIADPAELKELRYRGHGWPGDATARTAEDAEPRRLTYEVAWGDILSKHAQWRCRLCADHTGEFADISVGDPWYREVEQGESGSSLILTRTERGRRALEEAIAAGYVRAEPADPAHLPGSQPNLLRARGAVIGRITTLRLLGLPAPRYRGFPMWCFWMSELGLSAKLRSFLGTLKRVWLRRLYRPFGGEKIEVGSPRHR